MSGFESTGVFPTNPLKYQKNRLDPKMLEQYNQLHPTTVEEPTPTTSSENHSDDASADESHQYLPGTSSSPDEEDAQVASEQNIDILATPSTSSGWLATPSTSSGHVTKPARNRSFEELLLK